MINSQKELPLFIKKVYKFIKMNKNNLSKPLKHSLKIPNEDLKRVYSNKNNSQYKKFRTN